MSTLTFHYADPNRTADTVTVHSDTARRVMAGLNGPGHEIVVTGSDGTVVRAMPGEVAWIEESPV